MYDLIEYAKQNMQQYSISGTVGSAAFDNDNVIKGSLSVSNQCTDGSTFRLGGACIGQMRASFTGLGISRNEWVGKEIEFEIEADINTIPVGKFYVDSAKHSRNITSIVAYDNMAKFNKAVGVDAGAYGTMYGFLTLACDACGVDLGMTEEEVEALPNGNMPFVLWEMGDIETWRDLIYWIAVSLCSFATLNRNGDLVIKTFHTEIDDTLDSNIRINTSEYGDEIITYTGVEVLISEENAVKYYHAEEDTGYTLNMGRNPFYQCPEAQRQDYMVNFLAALANIQYNPCKVEIPFGVQYDLGDVLKFPNGQGSATNLFCVLGYSWIYYGKCTLKSIAGQKQSMNKTDKNLQGLLSEVSKKEFTAYELRNTGAIIIEDGEEERILSARIASNASTKAQIHIELNLESEAVSEDYTQGIVTYIIDSEENTLHPTETWIDGKHVMHLMYILPLQANSISIFDLYMQADGGNIAIGQGDVWLYASGAGLVGDGSWDGKVNIQEAAADWQMIEITYFAPATESLTVAPQVPTGGTFSDTAAAWNLGSLTFAALNDSASVVLHSDSVPIYTEEGDSLTDENNEGFYTEGD